MALKELEVRYATKRQKDYKLADGEGLYVLVRPNGSKLWRLKYRFGGKEKLLSIGPYPKVSLADARLRRAEAKVALGQGRDPGAQDTPAHGTTFEEAARAWHANRLSSLEPSHAERLMTRLERDAFPALGAKQLKEITSSDVLAMVRTVEARGALDVSRRLKQHVSQIYRFAIPQGWAEQDPAAHITDLLKPKPRVRHMPRVGVRELAELVRAIDQYDGEENPRRRAITRAAMLFTLLTWARTNETRLATWDELEGLDTPEPLWRVPAERMKMEREHLVPLSSQVRTLLQRLPSYRGSGFVFPGDKPAQPLSQNTMIYACYRMGYRGRQTVHGFRGLASTWANEAEDYRSDWIEMALAHAEQDEVRGAYNGALYLTPRRRMLQDWGDFIAGMMEGEGERARDAAPRLESTT
ncbi:integrase [Novosphingobium chloroacetimidivorans]|uniref:Integrase n=1 Tax=Novosphingobium chloroacetimidivorans TaxID=1428314 RepID=A0A7W7NZ48_9SPHN|nr:integrase arm-type DNA-binding domain-containing protein [Novosphingobium chloroacetimidivorans]MBB4860842.1 integrase [Novosphingobium chloroacetimidivorans]